MGVGSLSGVLGLVYFFEEILLYSLSLVLGLIFFFFGFGECLYFFLSLIKWG